MIHLQGSADRWDNSVYTDTRTPGATPYYTGNGSQYDPFRASAMLDLKGNVIKQLVLEHTDTVWIQIPMEQGIAYSMGVQTDADVTLSLYNRSDKLVAMSNKQQPAVICDKDVWNHIYYRAEATQTHMLKVQGLRKAKYKEQGFDPSMSSYVVHAPLHTDAKLSTGTDPNYNGSNLTYNGQYAQGEFSFSWPLPITINVRSQWTFLARTKINSKEDNLMLYMFQYNNGATSDYYWKIRAYYNLYDNQLSLVQSYVKQVNLDYPTDTQWHDFAVTYDGDNANFYIDAKLAGTIYLRSSQRDTHYFGITGKGCCSDFYIYKEIIPQQQLTTQSIKKRTAVPSGTFLLQRYPEV